MTERLQITPLSDRVLLFTGRCFRMFAYGFLAIVLALYLRELGFSEASIGLLLTLTLVGDIPVSLLLTTSADRIGRRRTLVIGAVLMLAAGVVFVSTGQFWLLLLAATVGVISPSGYEVGPFLPVEQAALSHVVSDNRRTAVFAWYNLAGTLATAVGSLAGGALAHYLQTQGHSALVSYRWVLAGYAGVGAAMMVVFLMLSSAVEVEPNRIPGAVKSLLGLHTSRRKVLGLSGLFAIDALGGGFVVQSIIVLWFANQYPGISELKLGTIFFGANLLAAASALSASWLASRIGLINTMVFTHLPSNILLILVPFMPNLPLAIAMLLLRFSISQMDVPTRQSYTMAIVSPDERSAAAGVTGVARSVGAMLSPSIAGRLLQMGGIWTAMPFVIGGGLKVIYDLALYRSFQRVKPPEESVAAAKA